MCKAPAQPGSGHQEIPLPGHAAIIAQSRLQYKRVREKSLIESGELNCPKGLISPKKEEESGSTDFAPGRPRGVGVLY